MLKVHDKGVYYIYAIDLRTELGQVTYLDNSLTCFSIENQKRFLTLPSLSFNATYSYS